MFGKINRLPLLVKLFIAGALGIVCGLWLNDMGIRVLTTFQALFSQFIKFLVPFIILGFVTPAIADTGRNAGRTLLLTMGLAYASTIFAGYFAYGVSSAVFPSLLGGNGIEATAAAKTFPTLFTLKIPPVVDVVTALVVSFMIGLGISATNAESVYRGFSQLRAIVERTLAKAFVPFLPLYILTVTAELTASGRLASIAGPAVRLMLCCTAITLTLLVIQYFLAGMVAMRNPVKALWTMVPAYLTGWGTCSSAATIPVTLARVRQNGVSEPTANLVVPLCSNVHLSGSMANVVAYAAGILAMFGDPISIGPFTEYILAMSIVAVASPGVPGGCVLAAGAFVESALGFTPERYALMVAIYMALDGMGTACNLTGDGAIALIVDRLAGKRSSSSI